MNIVCRNLFRLLRSGAFSNNGESIEAMSAYKWRLLCQIGNEQHVAEYLLRAQSLIPSNVVSSIGGTGQQDSNGYSFHSSNLKKDFEQLRLNTLLSGRALKTIINKELHAIDTSADTLVALKLIIDAFNAFMESGIVLQKIILLGTYLREKGHRVDFDKLEMWLKKLNLSTGADMLGTILISLFGFDKEEVPFVRTAKVATPDVVMKTLTDTSNSLMASGCLSPNATTTTPNIKHKSLGRALRRSMRMFGYAPMESLGHAFNSLGRRITEIEE